MIDIRTARLYRELSRSNSVIQTCSVSVQSGAVIGHSVSYVDLHDKWAMMQKLGFFHEVRAVVLLCISGNLLSNCSGIYMIGIAIRAAQLKIRVTSEP
jgi:hypothetical protein